MMFKFLLETIFMVLMVCRTGHNAHLNDPEDEVIWTPPSVEAEFESVNMGLGASYVGLLFAGRVEFNWLVDIRADDEDQEAWSIGNLLSYYHVLTTCRAYDFLQLKSADLRQVIKDEIHKWDQHKFINSNNIFVYFCENYLWETGKLKKAELYKKGYKISGIVSSDEIFTHEQCSRGSLIHDAAILVLNGGIPGFEPQYGFMPTGYDYVTDKVLTKVKLDPTQQQTHHSPLCYVASYGRSYSNIKQHIAIDYKVKFRVYVEPWDRCKDRWKYVCSMRDGACNKDDAKLGKKHLLCLRPRAKVGTVCDHDRGAPLVCNDVVIGMVVRGPELKYCNNLFKIPFIVELLDSYQTFIDDSLSYMVKPIRKKGERSPFPSPRPESGALAHKGMNRIFNGFLAFLVIFTSHTSN